MLSFVNISFKGNKLLINNQLELSYDEVYVLQRLLDSLISNNQTMKITYGKFDFSTYNDIDPLTHQSTYRLVIHEGPKTVEISGDSIKFQALSFALLRLISIAPDKFVPIFDNAISTHNVEYNTQQTIPQPPPVTNNSNDELHNIITGSNKDSIVEKLQNNPVVEVDNYNPQLIDEMVKTLFGLVLAPSVDSESLKKVDEYLKQLGIDLKLLESASAVNIVLSSIKAVLPTFSNDKLKEHILVDVEKLGSKELKKYVQDKITSNSEDSIKPMFVAFRLLSELKDYQDLAGGLI